MGLFIAAFTLVFLTASESGCHWIYVYADQGHNSYASALVVGNNNYFVVGDMDETPGEPVPRDARVLKIRFDGLFLWSRLYGSPGIHEQIYTAVAADSGLVMAGFVHPEAPPQGTDGWVTKLDADGAIQWSRSFGGPNNESISHIVQIQDGGFVAVGSHTLQDNSHQVWVLRLGPDGTHLWDHTYGSEADETGQSVDVVSDEFGPGFIVSANKTGPGSWSWWILRLDTNGGILWEKTYRHSSPGSSFEPIAIPAKHNGQSDGFLLGGKISGGGYPADTRMVLKLNSSGKVEWKAIYTDPEKLYEGELESLKQLSDGGFILAGRGDSDLDEGNGWLLKLAYGGEVQWSKSIGGSKEEWFLDVAEIPEGLVATGRARSSDLSWDFWAAKTNKQGRIPFCSWVQDRPVVKIEPDVEVSSLGITHPGPGIHVGHAFRPPPSKSFSDKFSKICPADCLRFVDVNTTAPSPQTGTSWEQAFPTVQQGIDSAAEQALFSSTACEVWAAKGTYSIYKISPEDTVQLKSKVHVYGGFKAGDEYFDLRDWKNDKTVLTGSDGTPANRVYHVVTSGGFLTDSVIDGFHVRDGRATGPMGFSRVGGGMLNTSGAQLLNAGGWPVVRNCVFENNEAELGGGMLNFQAGPTIQGCYFRNNRAVRGGGMANYDSSSYIERVVFQSNQAVEGGGVNNYFGGTFHPPVIKSSIFTLNQADYGSALFNRNHPLASNAAPWVMNSLFYANSAAQTGAIINLGGGATPTLANCTIRQNKATQLTGGIRNVASNPIIVNTILWDNHVGLPAEISNDGISTPSVTYSNIQGGYTGLGNINANPLFTADSKLMPGSPCIDTGNTVFWQDLPDPMKYLKDLAGSARVVDSIDLGAFEKK